MEARFIGIGRWRVLVARPQHHAFGILVTDVLIALHVAKQAHDYVSYRPAWHFVVILVLDASKDVGKQGIDLFHFNLSL